MTDLTHDTTLLMLPLESRRKLERLAFDREAWFAARRDASTTVRVAHENLQRVKIASGYDERLRIIQADAYRAHFMDPAKVRADIEARTAELGEVVAAPIRRLHRAQEALERVEAREANFAYLHGVENWSRETRETRLRHCAVKIRSKDTHADILRARSELADLEEEWAAVEAAPAPASVLLDQALREIDNVANTGAINVAANNRAGSPLRLAERIALKNVPIQSDIWTTGNAGAPLFVWLLKPMLEDRARDIIASLDQTGVLTDEQQAARFKQITTKRLEIERREEALVCLAEIEGRPIARRAYADPRAILEIEEVAA